MSITRLLDTGTWCTRAPTEAARNAAAAFLAMDADEVSEEDISDVLGELANIVGGNVKACCRRAASSRCRRWCWRPSSATQLAGRRADQPTSYGDWDGEPVSISHVAEPTSEKEEAGMKILIADDSRVMRQIVTRTLRQAGFGDHDLVEAADGTAGARHGHGREARPGHLRLEHAGDDRRRGAAQAARRPATT